MQGLKSMIASYQKLSDDLSNAIKRDMDDLIVADIDGKIVETLNSISSHRVQDEAEMRLKIYFFVELLQCTHDIPEESTSFMHFKSALEHLLRSHYMDSRSAIL